MANVDEIAFLDATAQAELVRNKEITPSELVQAAIERIERLNPSLNAVITPMYDQPRERAAGPTLEGPFAGVPFLLKDIIASCAGVRMALGTALLCSFVPDHDSELILRHKKAGLIALWEDQHARTGTCPHHRAGCLRPNQESLGYREDHRRVVWRFRGGCGFGYGSYGPCQRRRRVDPDSGFLLRGFRPQTHTTAQSVGTGFWGLVVPASSAASVTRSVRDSAALLDATTGPDIGDPSWAPPPRRPFLEEVRADPGRLRIALSADFPFGLKPHEDCVTALKEAAALCESLGHVVEEVAPSITHDPANRRFHSCVGGRMPRPPSTP